jgi:hypothetical protein
VIENLEQYKAARLKRGKVTLPDSDLEIEIQECTTAGWTAVMAARRDHPGDDAMQANMIVLHGVPAFANESVESIAAALTVADAMAIAEAVMRLSGFADEETPEKN